MATLTELRQGVADQLATIPGIQAHAKMLSSPYLPIAYVVPGEIDFHKTMQDGHSDWNLIVELHVATFSDIGGQEQLDALISESGPKSVKAALENDPTLGGLADDLVVQGIRNYGPFVRPSGAEPVLGAQVLVWVLAAGD